MTCRHAAGDPNCSSHPDHPDNPSNSRYREDKVTKLPETPDAEDYEITNVLRVGEHLVLKVKYPNCRSCAYEGQKVMVFLNVTEVEVLKWRRIDPHFRAPGVKRAGGKAEAPSPAARFPASQDGWIDAVAYATKKAYDSEKSKT